MWTSAHFPFNAPLGPLLLLWLVLLVSLVTQCTHWFPDLKINTCPATETFLWMKTDKKENVCKAVTKHNSVKTEKYSQQMKDFFFQMMSSIKPETCSSGTGTIRIIGKSLACFCKIGLLLKAISLLTLSSLTAWLASVFLLFG